MSTQYFHTIDETYYISLKVEENFDRKTQQNGRGRGSRGRGNIGSARGYEKEEESNNGQGGRGGNNIGRGRESFGRGKGKYVITCYHCGVEGHKKSKCLEKQNS